MAQKAPRVKISKEIALQLREQIMAGKYPVGSKLPTENELGRTFNVSRPSVREALTILEAEGLVNIIRGKGSFVVSQSPQSQSAGMNIRPDFIDAMNRRLADKPASILAVMELREILECEMVQLAAVRATPEDIMELKVFMKRYSLEAKAHKETVDADFMIHYGISKASRNEFLCDLIGRLQEIYKRIILSKRKQPKSQEEFDKEVEEHILIIEAVEKHDPVLAKEAMKAHLVRSHQIAEGIILNQLQSTIH
jgi:DNA-binding FadR family transcriptional regulator